MVEGLLRDFVQEDWLALIDFTTLEKQGGSYVTDRRTDSPAAHRPLGIAEGSPLASTRAARRTFSDQ